MSIMEALVLGLVQGLTEFLPVSSSGHLVLLQKIFGLSQDVLVFDTLIHGATLLAVFAVLWRDIWSILRKPLQPLTGYLVLATLPAVGAALLFRNLIEGAFASGAFLGFGFLITSAFLSVSEFLSRRPEKPQGMPGKLENPPPGRLAADMTWSDALVIGLLQAAAILPGISRSGSTLAGALGRGFDRDFGARFSFLLSIPAILGALVLQLRDLSGPETAPLAIGLPALAVGSLSAAVVGFFAVKLTLSIVRRRSLLGFALYTGFLGVLVLADQFGIHRFFL